MAAKAKVRRVIAEAEEATRDAARLAALREANPPAHPDENGPISTGEHAGHYTHWRPAHGNGEVCSCGAIVGCFSVAVGSDDPPPPEECDICDARKARSRGI